MGPNRSQPINSSGCVILVPVGLFGFDEEGGFSDFLAIHASYWMVSTTTLLGITISFTSVRDERV